MVNRDRLVRTFLELVAIDSESLHERRMADHLKEQYRELGIVLEEDDAGARIGGDAGNLFGLFASDDPEAETVLLSGHMDTVVPGIGKKAIVREDGTITSDGTTVLGADDAAANAIILEALREVREEGKAHHNVEILHTVAEEIYGLGVSAFDASRIRAKRAYCLDCSDRYGAYSAQEPTLITFTVRVQGLSAHAGFDPESGVHSIAAASAAINRLDLGHPDPETTLNIGKICGGRATNIVPEETVVEGEIRSGDHAHALAVYDETIRIFREEAERIGGRIEAERIIRLRAYHVAEDDPALAAYRRALEKQGVPAYAKKNFGGSDMNILIHQGIDGICLFNSMHRCHSTEEYAVIEEMAGMVDVVRSLITMQK